MTRGTRNTTGGGRFALALAGILVVALVVTASVFGHAAATPIQQAQAELATAKPPATIFAHTKSTKPLPIGPKYHLSYVHCGQPGCTDVSNGLAAAIKGMKLGWTYTVIPTDGSPQQVQNGWKTALRNGSTAIMGTGFPVSYFAQQLKEAQSKHIPVFSGYVLDKPQAGFYPFGGTSDVVTIGNQMAAWVTVKTKGKANVLFVDLPAFPILAPVKTSFMKWYPKYCPGCPVDTLTLAITDLGKDAPAKIVSYLRSHPSINYIAYVYDGVGIGVPAALKLAGLADKVKIIGESPSAQNIADVAAGRQEMTVAQGYYESMAAAVNQMARAFTGQKVLLGEMKLAYWAFAKSSPPSWVGSGRPAVKNLYGQFLSLWPK